jgi:hypothetical protein
MIDLRKAAEMALEALEANDKLINGTKTHGGLVFAMDGYYSGTFDIDETNQQTEQAITALRQALAKPVDLAKVGEVGVWGEDREWVGLTDNEARKFYEKYTNREELIYAIDEFLEEKNHADNT